MYLLGSDTQASVGRIARYQHDNRAMTQAEMSARFLAGVSEQDSGASQTQIINNGDFEEWASSTNLSTWVEGSSVSASVSQVSGGDQYAGTYSLQFTGSGNPSVTVNNAIQQSTFSVSDVGRRVRFSIAAKMVSGSGRLFLGQGSSEYSTIPAASLSSEWQVFVLEKVITDLSSAQLRQVMLAGDSGVVFQVDAYSVQFVGITVNLQPSSIQLAPGQWLDTSGKKSHVHIIDGCRLLNPDTDGQVRGTNVWAAADTLQYLNGVNANILATNAYIDTIIIVPSASYAGGFEIGDGTDADRYATVAGPVAAGIPIRVGLNTNLNDGTNRKLTIKPTAAYTGTVTTTVFVNSLEA